MNRWQAEVRAVACCHDGGTGWALSPAACIGLVLHACLAAAAHHRCGICCNVMLNHGQVAG